jgi:hypothetical protein
MIARLLELGLMIATRIAVTITGIDHIANAGRQLPR